MKYILCMIEIWKNFYLGRNKFALIMVILLQLYFIIIGFIIAGILGVLITGLVWLFAAPAAIFLIDADHKKHPNKPKSLKSIFKILFP